MEFETRQRIFDICTSIFALAVLWPVLLIVAILIKLDSPGPFLFRQTRVGHKGKHFQIYKFRSMRDLKPDEVNILVTGENNIRITKLGAKLRRSKLDELPQLFNVLFGDMSIVGPRPEVPEFANQYTTLDYQTLISARPGISDPTSILFINEEEILAHYSDKEIQNVYLKEIVPQKMAIVRNYAKDRHIRDDIRIVAKTILEIFSKFPKQK